MSLDLSLVFPCYREEGHLERNISRIVSLLSLLKIQSEIILVDDCSPDDTSKAIQSLIGKFPGVPIRAYFHLTNQGRGAAFVTGARAARGHVVGFFDVDLEVSPIYLVDCYQKLLAEDADLVIGARHYNLQLLRLHREILSRGYAWMVSKILGIPRALDSESGYKFFKRTTLDRYLDHFVYKGWFWDTEVVTRFYRGGLKVRTIPCFFIRDTGKKSTVKLVRDTYRYLRDLVTFRRSFRTMVTPTQVPAPASSTKPYIVFGQPRISDEEIEGVAQVLKSGWIGTGPRSIEFEKAFARYQDSPHALAVGSCTAALYLALKAYGIGPGDEVITSAMTFAATVNAILHVGAKPIVVDIEKNTLKIDLKKTAAAITPRTRAILPVHFAGEAVDMDELQRLGRQYGVRIIHDCAHAIETRWKGRTIPSYGDVACYSFYSTKNITTIEGGMLCSGDEVFIHRARLLSNHGLSKDAWKRFSVSGYQHYDIVEPGFKFNFTDVQAALGLAQLAKIGSHYEKRSAVWTRYQREFAELPFRCPNEMSREHLHARHLYPILIDEARCGIDRDTFLIRLHALGIGCGVHYRAIPQMSAFQKLLGLDLKDFPNAVRVGNTTLSLPLTPYLSEADVTRVIEAVKEVLSEGASLKRAA